MGNAIFTICCGDEEDYKQSAWYSQEDADADEDWYQQNGASFGADDEDKYDDKATDREQLILLHESKRRSSKGDSEMNNGDGGVRRGMLHRKRSTRILKRDHIQSTPMDYGKSFKFEPPPSCPKSDATTEFLLNAVGENFVFDSIGDATKLLFVNAMQVQEFNKGDWVMCQGDVGDYFYIVEEGGVSFHVGVGEGGNIPPQVGTGTTGSTFGELALLYNTPRAASVRALTYLKLFKIDQITFRSLLMSHQLNDRSNLISLVQKVCAFQGMDEAKMHKLVDAFTIVEFSPGERIVNKGDAGNVMYIVKSGEVKVDDIGHGSSKFSNQTIVEGGCFGERALLTGETRAANVSAVTQSSLLAISKGVLEEIIGPLEEAVSQSSYSEYLKSTPLLGCLEMDEISRCVKYLREESFKKGEKIGTRGKMYLIQEGHVLMMINDESKKEDDANGNGEKVVKKMNSGPTLVKFEKGDYFGDLFGMFEENGTSESLDATGKFDGSTVNVEEDMKCLTLSAWDIKTVLGGDLQRLSAFQLDLSSVDESDEDDENDDVPPKKRRSRMRVLMQSASDLSAAKNFIKEKKSTSDRNVMNLSKLKKHRVLGMGTFGKVWLVTPKSNAKDNPTPYALKMVSKRLLLQQNLAPAVMREKNVMESIQHPFLLNMVSSFQDEDYLYFVMNLILGGELFELVYGDEKNAHKDNPAWKESALYKSFGTEGVKQIKGCAGVGVRKALFYGTGVIEAFAYLHNRRIIYRDLKPENVMLDEKGYCVVVDMGFAKVVLDKTYTLCGTLEYLAPEVITNKGHNNCADYWSFACLLYELVVGHTPFFEAGLDQLSLLKKIIKADYGFPSAIDKVNPGSNEIETALYHWKDLIARLLKPKAVERIGNLRNGIEDILHHDWFDKIDFNEFRNQSMPSPWVPTIVCPLDTSHFAHNFGKDKPEVFRRKLSSKDQEVFRGF